MKRFHKIPLLRSILKEMGLEDAAAAVSELMPYGGNSTPPISKSARGRAPIPHLGVGPGQEVSAMGPLQDGVHYIYVLKLENKVDGEQVVDALTGSPIYNWYVGEAKNPITRFMQHKIGRLYVSPGGLGAIKRLYTEPFDKDAVEKFMSRKMRLSDIFSPNSGEAKPIDDSTQMSADYTEGNSHIRCGAAWTTLHRPIEMVHLEPIEREGGESKESFRERFLMTEVSIYKDVEEKYGKDHARGGNRCNILKSDPLSPYPSGASNGYYSDKIKSKPEFEIINYMDSMESADSEVIDAAWWLKSKVIDIFEEAHPDFGSKISDAKNIIKEDRKRKREEEERGKVIEIEKFLSEANGDRVLAAKLMGVKYQSLAHYTDKFGLNLEDYRDAEKDEERKKIIIDTLIANNGNEKETSRKIKRPGIKLRTEMNTLGIDIDEIRNKVEEIESNSILNALNSSCSIAEAARVIGMHPATFAAKMKKYRFDKSSLLCGEDPVSADDVISALYELNGDVNAVAEKLNRTEGAIRSIVRRNDIDLYEISGKTRRISYRDLDFDAGKKEFIRILEENFGNKSAMARALSTNDRGLNARLEYYGVDISGYMPKALTPDEIRSKIDIALTNNGGIATTTARELDVSTTTLDRYMTDLGMRPLSAYRREFQDKMVKDIKDAVLTFGGNKGKAAEHLGISMANLYKILEKWDVTGQASPDLI
jgi:DNA-binding protein Fis